MPESLDEQRDAVETYTGRYWVPTVARDWPGRSVSVVSAVVHRVCK